MRQVAPRCRLKRLEALSLTEPLPLAESDPPEWDSPLLWIRWLPYQLVASQRAINRAVQRFHREAPRDEVQRFEEVEHKVKQLGGWTPNDPETWKTLMALLLYDAYREHGEQVVLARLPALLQMDDRFFREQWWVKELIETWEQQEKEGRQKIKRLSTGQQGKWVSPQEQARIYARNLPLLKEIERRLEENRQHKIAFLRQAVEQKYEALHRLRLQFAPQNPHRHTLTLSVQKKADRLEREACNLLDKMTALQPRKGHDDLGYNEVLRQVTAKQEKFGCTDCLSFGQIRKAYEQYEERKRPKRR